jgi:hypothetical protein
MVVYLIKEIFKVFRHILVGMFSLIVLVGCASPQVVQEKQIGDSNLNCLQLTLAIEEAKDFEKKARNERKATGTNVAAAIFFWPGLFATYSNTEDAINAAKERQNHLSKIYVEKNCDVQTQTQNRAASMQIEQKLLELKSLFEKGLLTESEYQAARTRAVGM